MSTSSLLCVILSEDVPPVPRALFWRRGLATHIRVEGPAFL
jgi:hypothetical protein